MRRIAPLVASCLIASGASANGQLDFWFDLHEYVIETWLTKLKPGNSVPWQFADGKVLMHEWRGEYMSLLTSRNDYDPMLVQTLLDAADAYWLRCREICGNSPPPDPDKGFATNGRPMLVEIFHRAPDALVSAEESASPVTGTQHERAVGEIGVARTGIATEELESLLRAIAAGNSRAPLGMRLPNAIARNFYFFDGELGAIAPTNDIASAYAALLAGQACEALDWFAPNDNRPFDTTLERYERDPKATFELVLGSAASPSGYDVNALWTALLMRVSHASGQRDFIERLWRATSECPTAATQDDAVTNLVVAASSASGSDLSQRFLSWRFPVSADAKSRVREALVAQRVEPRKVGR